MKILSGLSPEKNFPNPFRLPWARDSAAIIALFLLSLFVFGQALSFPPRSDHWMAFYVFNHAGLGEIMNYEVFGHPRFQPLSHLILFFSYKIFGSHFFWHNLLHLLTYTAVWALFYFLIKEATASRLTGWLLAALGIAAFSHFDIASWSYHIYIVTGTLFVLTSVLFILHFHRHERTLSLWGAFTCLLLGSLCYEPYVFSCAILILTYTAAGRPSAEKKHTLIKGILLFYGTYLCLFILFQFTPHMMPPALPSKRLNVQYWLLLFPAIATNTAYANFLLVLFPNIALPLNYYENTVLITSLERIGLFNVLEKLSVPGAIAAAFGLVQIRKKLRGSDEDGWRWPVLAGLLMMILTYSGTVIAGRMLTNPRAYSYVQFRYQFFPDLLVFACAGLLIGAWIKAKPRPYKIVVQMALSILIINNLYNTKRSVEWLDALLKGHQILISHITEGIQHGIISERNKLYIDDQTLKANSPWNTQLGQYPGNIQWLFPGSGSLFVNDERLASFIVDSDLQLKKRM